MKTYNVFQIDSFTKELFRGNPAGVVTNADGLTTEEMQQIARELNNSETAFVLSSTDPSYDVEVRFFTPSHEVPICGHATIAAHYARAIENKLDSCRVFQKTGAGILPVDVIREEDDYKLIMTQGDISFGEVMKGRHLDCLLMALGLESEDLRVDCPVCIASTGHSKVMIGIKDINKLHRLNPDMSQLSALSQEIGCNGYYVFTLHSEGDSLVHGRMFAPSIGIKEDPVTGNANGPLGAYLIHWGVCTPHSGKFEFRATQGEAMGRAGSILVRVSVEDNIPVKVQIEGRATVVFKTVITF